MYLRLASAALLVGASVVGLPAPPLSTPSGDAPATGTDWSAWQGVNRLSRFTLSADWTLNMSSERVVLNVPAVTTNAGSPMNTWAPVRTPTAPGPALV
jgi:hypothetical protein